MIFEASVLGESHRVEVRAADSGYRVVLDGRPLEVVVSAGRGFVTLTIGSERHELGVQRQGGAYHVVFPGDSLKVELEEPARGARAGASAAHGPARLLAPMPGRIVRVQAAAGAEVAAGQGLVVIEAMKMENELRAPRAGRVQELLVREGQAVEAGALLAVIG